MTDDDRLLSRKARHLRPRSLDEATLERVPSLFDEKAIGVPRYCARRMLLPMSIRFDLVDEDRTLLSAVARQVALTVSVEIQAAEAAPATHGILPDPGV